jgi:hypothetical protein
MELPMPVALQIRFSSMPSGIAELGVANAALDAMKSMSWY